MAKYRENREYHILYKTTNIVNQKIYVGVHSTDILEDGYLGSGLCITSAIKKYGRENFTRQILEFFSGPEEMLLAEANIVTPEFVERPDVYNIITGGYGGKNKGTTGMKHMYDPKSGDRCAVHQNAVPKMLQEGWVLGRNMSSTTGTVWIHKGCDKKMIDPINFPEYKENGWSSGLPKSPTAGKLWIFNEQTNKYSLCEPQDLENKLSSGWIKKKWAPIKKGQEIVTCPHCGKSGGKNGMKGYHFNKCPSLSK